MKSAVIDYLMNLEEDELIGTAAAFLGYDYSEVDYDVALQWVDGLSDTEIAKINTQMGGDQ